MNQASSITAMVGMFAMVAVIGAGTFLSAQPARAQTARPQTARAQLARAQARSRLAPDLCETELSGGLSNADRLRLTLQHVRPLLNAEDLRAMRELLVSGKVANPISNSRRNDDSRLGLYFEAFAKVLAMGIKPEEFHTELRSFLAKAKESEDKREVQRKETEMVFNPTIANTIPFGGEPGSHPAVKPSVIFRDRAWALVPDIHIPSLNRVGTFLFDLESEDPVWEVPINTVLIPTPKRLLAVASAPTKSKTGQSINLLIWDAETKDPVKVVEGISGFRVIPGSPERLLVMKADSLSILDLQTLTEKNIADLRMPGDLVGLAVTKDASNEQVLGLVHKAVPGADDREATTAYDVIFINLAAVQVISVIRHTHPMNFRQILLADVGDGTVAVLNFAADYYLIDTRSKKADRIRLPDDVDFTSDAIIVDRPEGPMAYIASRNALMQIDLKSVDLKFDSHPRKVVNIPPGMWKESLQLDENQLVLGWTGRDTQNIVVKVDLKDSSLRASPRISIATADNTFPRRFLIHEGEVYAYGRTGPAGDDIEIRHIGSPMVYTLKGMAAQYHLILRGQPYIVAKTDRSVHLIRLFSEAQTSTESGRSP